MRNRDSVGPKACAAVLFFAAVLLLPMPVFSGEEAAETIEALRARVEALEARAADLEEQNRGLRAMLEQQESDDLYLVVDTEVNRLMIRKGAAVIRKAVCGTGSRQYVESETGRHWFFESPMGSYTVLGKERNPVWIRPDWSFVEENMPIPPINDPDRIVRGVMGKYALLLGNGYKIHGTTWTKLLGTNFTHGCISLDDDDLEAVYKAAQIGTKVYLY